MSKKLLKLSRLWAKHPVVSGHLVDTLSENQKDVMTPVIIDAKRFEVIQRSFLDMYRIKGTIYSPQTFRYSYAINAGGQKNVSIVPLYYLEKDLNMLHEKFGILTNISGIVPSGESWEEAVYDKLEYYSGNCEETAHKLIKVRDSTGAYRGWSVKEIFKDKVVT